MTDVQEQASYHLELSVEEVFVLFDVLGLSCPPFISGGGRPDEAGQEAAKRSLLARGLVRIVGEDAEMPEAVVDLLEIVSRSPAVLRVHRSVPPTEDLVTWYTPAEAWTVRTEITPLGTCRLLQFNTQRLLALLAVDAGLADLERVPAGRFDIEMSSQTYGTLLTHLSEKNRAGAVETLVSCGVDPEVAAPLADGLLTRPMAVNVALMQPVESRPSAVEVGMVAWLDAGPAGVLRVEGPDLGAIRQGLTGEETVRVFSAPDEQVLDEVGALFGSG